MKKHIKNILGYICFRMEVETKSEHKDDGDKVISSKDGDEFEDTCE